jgi:hypothetical protein
MSAARRKVEGCRLMVSWMGKEEDNDREVPLGIGNEAVLHILPHNGLASHVSSQS